MGTNRPKSSQSPVRRGRRQANQTIFRRAHTGHQPPTPKQQKVFELRKQGKSFPEIAKIMGFSERVAQDMFKAAAQKLKLSPETIKYIGSNSKSRRRNEILDWLQGFIPELIHAPGEEIRANEITEKIHQQFPMLKSGGIHQRYTRPLLQILFEAGIIRKEKKPPQIRYFVQWPPKPPVRVK